MKNTLILAMLTVLFCQCKNKVSSNTTLSTSKNSTATLVISSASQSAYENVIEREKAISPIGRLCAESKGYRKDEWDALNECSWAIEKHDINLHPKQVKREGGQLFISLADSTIVLTHQADEYYQFVNFLATSKHIVIRVLRPAACPEYWLIQSDTGQKKVLAGEPVFSGDKSSFLLTTSTVNKKLKCPNALSYWALNKGTFEQISNLNSEQVIHNLLWYNNQNWLAMQGGKIIQIGVDQKQ